MNNQAPKEFRQPDDPSELVWRYMDLPKLLSLLLKKELHLTRLDSLEDKYEGTLPLQTLPAMIAELRPTMSSAKAWSMIEKSVSVLRKLPNRESVKHFAERYFNATPDDGQDRFAARFAVFMIFLMMQITRASRAAGLAALEAKNENPALQAQLDDAEFYRRLADSRGVLPGNDVLLELEMDYERIPPEEREAAIRELANWTLMQFANIRQQLFVSCWRIGNRESEAMWRIYCGREDGVAIVLPYARLRDSTKQANTFIGKVKYIPYESALPTLLSNFSLAMHKRDEFRHENEVRIVQQALTPTDYPKPGTFVRMFWDPAAHVERIVISPYSRAWYADTVKEIVDRIAPGLSGSVVDSAMSGPPFVPDLPDVSSS